MAAQELVGGGKLGADARGLAARVLRDALGSRQAPAHTLGLRVGLRALLPRLRHLGLRLLDKRALALVLALQLGNLALDLLLAAGLDLGQLRLQRRDAALARRLLARLALRPCSYGCSPERESPCSSSSTRSILRASACALEPTCSPRSARRSCAERAP